MPDKYKCEDPVQDIGIIILVKKCIWLSGQKERCQMDTIKTDNALFRKKIIIT